MKRLLLSMLGFFSLINYSAAQNNYNITELGRKAVGDNGYANIWGYAQGNKEYALLGCTGGSTNAAMAIIDVTNPTSPTQLFIVPGPPNIWREIRTHQHYAYITAEAADNNFGVTIVDLQYLPDSIKTKQYTANGLFGNVHALHIEDGYMYLYGSQNSESQGGALIIDLVDPWNPALVGAYDEKYVHDGIVRGNRMYPGEIFDGTFSIIDITNKQNPVVINTQITPNAFTHNTWLSTNSKYIYTTDERANSYVTSYDIQSEGNIVEVDRYRRANLNEAIPHNTYVLNAPAITGNSSDYLHTSYYTEGTTIVDATKPDNLVEVGHFDTSPNVGSGFSGAWGVYPYLPSGNLLVSDMQLGLFVLDPTYVRASYVEGFVRDAATNQLIPNATVEILSTGKIKEGKLTGQYKTGMAFNGNQLLRFSAPGYEEKDVTAAFVPGQTTNLDVALLASTVGVDTKKQGEVFVFPTIFSDEIWVQAPEHIVSYQLYDLNGKLLKQDALYEQNFKIPSNLIPAGSYLLKLETASGKIMNTQKLIKK